MTVVSLTRKTHVRVLQIVNSYAIEMAAGLQDEGETAEETALRELKEETGYTGTRIIKTSPVLISDPGMTSANMRLVTVEVDLDDPRNEVPETKLERGEFVNKLVVDMSSLSQTLEGENASLNSISIFDWVFHSTWTTVFQIIHKLAMPLMLDFSILLVALNRE